MSFQKNDIIIRDDGAYPEGALVVDGFDAQNQLLAHPLGGGLQITIPTADFARFRVATPAELQRVFRFARFSLEGVDQSFKGWTDGHRWNGWAQPAFEWAEAEKVVVAICPEQSGYSSDSDRFITIAADGEEESWFAELIQLPNGESVKVYPIGAGAWTWDEEGGGSWD